MHGVRRISYDDSWNLLKFLEISSEYNNSTLFILLLYVYSGRSHCFLLRAILSVLPLFAEAVCIVNVITCFSFFFIVNFSHLNLTRLTTQSLLQIQDVSCKSDYRLRESSGISLILICNFIPDGRTVIKGLRQRS